MKNLQVKLPPWLLSTVGGALFFSGAGSASAAVVDLSAAHNFAAPANIGASGSTSLPGLSSLAEFQALNAANRYVYSFETWPEAANNLGANPYTFQFDTSGDGIADQRITFKALASFTPNLTRSTNAAAASPSTMLGGLGDMGWAGYNDHTFTFETPVSAVGVVYRSAYNLLMQKNVWNAENYPVSYKLSDGTWVNLGEVGVSAGTITANTNTFMGVIDTTGKGIVSVCFRVKGTNGGGSQWTYLDDLVFCAMPEPATQANPSLKASHDFRMLSNVAASAAPQLAGLVTLDEFRQTGALHNRFVYSFNTWPTVTSGLGTNNYTFNFDLNGDGAGDLQVTANYTGSYSSTTQLSKVNLGTAGSSPLYGLGGLGDIGWGGATSAAHTFTFQKPVSAIGVVYRSSANVKLQKIQWNANNYPVSYTLTDGTVVNLGSSGVLGATIAANTNTFVGVKDTSGKGISSVTFRVQGSVGSSSQQAYIDDLAFALSGPPAGNWTLTLDEEFTGTTLNTARWSKGYRWADVINDELQAYRPENVTVANGRLTIKAEKRPAQNQDMYGYNGAMKSYASGAIQSYNKWTQAYGYFEARIRMSDTKGTWPAFWLLPDRGAAVTNLNWRVGLGNPNGLGQGNEIDVVEYMGSWLNPTTLLSKSHSGYFWGYDGNSATGDYARDNDGMGATLLFPNPHTEFHNYGVLWEPGKYTFYLDNKIVLTRTHATNIATVPHYLILNCALHTNDWEGAPVTIAELESGLPTTVDVEYVKVWSGSKY